MALEYGFEERLAMSSGVAASADVRSILLKHIPGAVNAHQAAAVEYQHALPLAALRQGFKKRSGVAMDLS